MEGRNVECFKDDLCYFFFGRIVSFFVRLIWLDSGSLFVGIGSEKSMFY